MKPHTHGHVVAFVVGQPVVEMLPPHRTDVRHAVAVEGRFALVGAFSKSDLWSQAGAAYLFRRDGVVWQQVAAIIDVDPAPQEYFGFSVALGGNTAIVGSPDDTESGFAAGAAHLYAVSALDDCNRNGVADGCDIDGGTSDDVNGNGVPDECDPIFRRGDANQDQSLDIADPILLLGFLFADDSVGCPAALDANDDEGVDIADAILILDHLFGGPPLPPPHPDCGIDPTGGALACPDSLCP